MVRLFYVVCALVYFVGAQNAATRPAFSNFPVKEVFRGKPAPPQLVTSGQRMFRTMIREGAQGPVAFAGHYTLPAWGCGSGCSEFAIVDSVTGKVFDVPFSVSLPLSWLDKHKGERDFKLMDYRPDSRLMKIDGCLNEADCGFYDFVMVEGNGLKLIRKTLLPREFQPSS